MLLSSLTIALCALALAEGLTVTVSTEAELTNAIVSGNTIELANDIYLTTSVSITSVTNITLFGNQFKIDGQNIVRCLTLNTASVKIDGLHITNGFSQVNYGAGLYAIESDVVVTNCNISHNVGKLGAGVYIDLYSTVTMDNCQVIFNTATYNGGGGMVIVKATVSMTNCVVSFNTATNYGGGVYLYAAPNYLSMTNCRISGNTATGVGYGGGLLTIGTTKLTGCTISENTAVKGGGLYIYSSSGNLVQLVGSQLVDNAALNGTDVYLGASASIEVYSGCPETEYSSGVGQLECLGCSEPYPADLTGACVPCSAGSYSCCGALECSADLPDCSTSGLGC